MSKTRRSLIRSSFQRLRQLWKRRDETRRDMRRCLGSTFELLEPRLALTISNPLPPVSGHIHPFLQLYLNGQQVVIPANVGLTSTQVYSPHTHDLTGKLHIGEGDIAGIDPSGSTPRNTTLKDFFDVWRTTNVGQSTNNPNAIFDTDATDGTTAPRFMGLTVDSAHVLRMYVKEQNVDAAPELEYDSSSSSNDLAHPETYVPRDGDQIIISYDAVAQVPDAPSFQTIGNQIVLGGAPTWLGIDGFDPTGGPLTYSVQVTNQSSPNLLQAVLSPSSNKSLVLDVTGVGETSFGQMTFQLFDDLMPRTTHHIETLVGTGGTSEFATNAKFYRVSRTGSNDFVIQGGPAQTTSSLGRFDDEFNTDLQFTTTGLLAMAKSSDDTNDSQIFVTGAPTRFLDMQHSIFGVLTQGEAVRQAIQHVPVVPASQNPPESGERPVSDVIISGAHIVTDTQNTALELKAAEGASGQADVTLTVTDAQGHSFLRTFHVTIQPDTANSAPFLSPIPAVTGVAGQPITVQLQATDVENNPNYFDATKPGSEAVNYTVNVNHDTGLVTINPPANFTGTFHVQMGVRGVTQTTTADQFDTQDVLVTVKPAAPTGLDLAATSDTGASNSDNITNATSLQFQVGGVTLGAEVKLMKGSTVLDTQVATGTTVTFTVANPGTALGQGTSALTAIQTVSGQTSAASIPLNVTYDTVAPTFSSTAPTRAPVGFNLNYNAQTNEEGGTSGVVYSLTNAPTGATINSSTGVVTWTPVSGDVGTKSFNVVATDAAGNAFPQPVSVAVAVPQVDLSLTLTKLDGSPLTSLAVGQDFLLHVFGQDLRSQAQGVFALYTDITFDSTKATATGNVQYVSPFTNGQSGTTTTAGLIDEAGSFQGGTNLGGGVSEIFKVPMRATASGTLAFATDPTDATDSTHDVLVLGQDTSVPPAQIHYGTASIEVASTFNAVNDPFNVNEDTANNTINPLANDTSIGGATNTLSISAVGATNHGGVVTITQNNTRLSYTPANNFVGSETFTYTARNQSGEEHTATVTMTVADVNDPPVATNDVVSAQRNSTNTALDVLANDTTGNDTGETLRVTAVTQGNHGGTITIGANGANVLYTPAANFSGAETFTYTVSDRATGGLTAQATATVNVSALNADPDAFTVQEDSSATTLDVLANDDLDPQVGGDLTITSVGQNGKGDKNGTVTIASDNKHVIYTPAANFQGTEKFTYTITDGHNNSATGTVTMTVNNVNDPPSAVNDTLTALRDSPNTLDVLANDTSGVDPTENLLIDSVGTPGHGTATVSSDGKKVIYTPAAGYTGADSFTYTIKDPGGLTSTATANVTIQAFTLSGFVYFDVNNNGIKDAGELPIAGATITLSGTLTGQTTGITPVVVKTGDDGSYHFDVAFGTYSITETQPAFTIDGKVTPGSQGGTQATNQIKSITVSSSTTGTTGANNNFGERGRALATITLRDFFSSTSRNYAHAAFNSSGTELWHVMSGSVWAGYSNNVFSLLNNNEQIKLDGMNPQSQPVTRTLNTTLPVYLSGQDSGNRLYYLPGGYANSGAANLTPVALADTYATLPGTALTVTAANGVLKNDTDPENNILTAAVVTQPAHGTLTLNSNGSFTYTPANSFTGADTFTYKASDGVKQSAAATVTINVGNQAPAALADTYSATEDTTLPVPVANGVLKNDSDPEGTTLTASVDSQPTKGTLTFNNDGSFTYTPNANANGSDTFTYKASDSVNQSAVTTVTINIAAVNDAPAFTLAGNPAAVDEDSSAVTVNNFATAISAGPSDEASQTLTFALTVGTPTGNLAFSMPPAIDSTGKLTYTPAANTTGTATISVVLNDNGSSTAPNVNASAAQTFTITVNGINDAPSFTLAGNPANVNEDSGAITVPNFITNISAGGSDESGQTLTFALTPGATTGGLTFTQAPAIDSTGKLTYTAAPNASGTATFSVVLSDNGSSTPPNVNASAAQTFTISVNPLNDIPVGVNDNYRVAPDTPLVVLQADGVLMNDTDADNEQLFAGDLVQPVNGDVSLNADGSFTYTPHNGFVGTDTFTYKAADDESAKSNVTTVTIVVNTAPVAANDPDTASGPYTTTEDQALTIDAAHGVLHNDTDVNTGDTLTATIVSQPPNGHVTLNTNGSFTYTPNANFNGTDTFRYQASDGISASAPATVTITVTPVNDPPVAVNDDYSMDEDGTLVKNAAEGVRSNDTDVDDATTALTVTRVNDVQHGTLTLNPDGSFTYHPNADFHGTDGFSYTVSDGLAASNAGAVTITINSVNDAPSFTLSGNPPDVDEDPGAVEVANFVTDVSAGAANESGQALTFHVTVTGATGNLTFTTAPAIDASGKLTYTPAANSNGTATVSVFLTDDGSSTAPNANTSATQTFTITVHAVNDPPVGSFDSYDVAQGGTLDVPLLEGLLHNDTDVEGDNLTAVLVSGPSHGSLTLNEDGAFTYSPNPGESGPDSFTYRPQDSNLGNETTVAIDIHAPPTVVDDFYTTSQNTQLDKDLNEGVLHNDITSRPIDAILGALPSHGSVTLNADGSFTYIPNQNYTGPDSFTYTATDGVATSGPATVTIDIAEGEGESASPSASDAALLAYLGGYSVGDENWEAAVDHLMGQLA